MGSTSANWVRKMCVPCFGTAGCKMRSAGLVWVEGAPSRPELRGLPLQTRRYRIRRVYQGYGWQSDTLVLHCPDLSASPSVVVTNLHSGWGQMYMLGRCPPLLCTHTSAEDIPLFRLLGGGCLVRLDLLCLEKLSVRGVPPHAN